MIVKIKSYINKRKGFTLIELLSVVVILAILLLIAVPAINSIVANAREDSYNNQVELIEGAAKQYSISQNRLTCDTTITVGELITENFLTEPVKDPRTNTLIDPTSFVTVECDVEGNQTFIFSNLFDDEIYPTLSLTDGDVIYLERGIDDYSELGFEALDNLEGDLTATVEVSGTYDINTVGTYSIIYTVSDIASNTTIVTRNLIVRDTIAPSVPTLASSNTNPTNTDIEITIDYPSDVVSKEYTLDGSTWFVYTSPIVLDSNIAVSARGTDASGNVSVEEVLDITNIDKEGPVISLTYDTLSIPLGNAYTDTGVTAIDNFNGDVTTSITSSVVVNTNIASDYTITYTAVDLLGNESTETRTITVDPRTEYRYRTSSTSCSTCYRTCTSSTSATQLSSTDSYRISSTTTSRYVCWNGSWSWSSSSCSGNCNVPCDTGYTKGSANSSGNCPVSGSCSTTSSSSCSTYWSAYCSKTTYSYTCPSGYSLSGTTCYRSYSCNPYSCGCSTSWSSWSAWTTTVYTSTSTREVETRIITSL